MFIKFLCAKELIAGIILSIVIFTIGYTFWHQEFQYQLPTPCPPDFQKPTKGTYIAISGITKDSIKPTFLHFFNPTCPCSKFNSKYVKQLIKKYSSKVDFKIVVSTKEKSYLANDIFGNNVEIILDTNGSIADACGVYSTPQAVILTHKLQLFYSGNYNKNRYCTTKNTNYAENALCALLAQNYSFEPASTIAYGCTLFNINQ